MNRFIFVFAAILFAAMVPNGEAYPTTKRCGGCGNWDHPDSVSVTPTTDA
ncbi:4208_t:CDS:1, partial [Funneliformis caledonium]